MRQWQAGRASHNCCAFALEFGVTKEAVPDQPCVLLPAHNHPNGRAIVGVCASPVKRNNCGGRMAGEPGGAELMAPPPETLSDPLALLGADLLAGSGSGGGGPLLVQTPDVQQALGLLAPWLRSAEPFILVGGWWLAIGAHNGCAGSKG
jgi:hypothetical protein